VTDRLLVVAATRAEAAYVPEGVPVVVTGLGKTAAAVVTTEALLAAERDGLTVVNIGSAGALRDGLSGLYEVGRVLNHDINGDAIRALGYDPVDVLDVGPSEIVLASGDLFVTDPAVRARLAERAHLVDMEAYGVVFACARLGVPVRVVKHVSDNADESALDWPAVVDLSARALGGWLQQALGGLGPAGHARG
jgi:adenosylhomocysteine nucleosidase